MKPADRLRQARIDAGFESGVAACKRFGWNYSTYTHHENDTRGISAKMAAKYASAFQVTPEWLLLGRGEAGSVPVVGYVGAGAEVRPYDDYERGDGLDRVAAPPGASKKFVAVRVRGDSMYPAYSDGDTLYYSEHAADLEAANNRDCVVHLADGRTLVKRVQIDSQGVTLFSHNAPPIRVDQLVWAAPIEWLSKA